MVNKENFLITPITYIAKKLRKLYLNSNLYDKKISRVFAGGLEYIPPLDILDCIIKVKKRKNLIEDYNIASVWNSNLLTKKDFNKLHSFFWFFTLDLKSSKEVTRSVISNWIQKNKSYNSKSWGINNLSKRIIAWISCSNNFYHGSDETFKIHFTISIKKQINHLIYEIENSEINNDKMLGCTATIMAGLCFKNQTKYLDFGHRLLKKIIDTNFYDDGFPKSRNPRELLFYTKYLILLRELLLNSNNEIPEHLNEIIFYLGKSFNFYFSESSDRFLFNGNHYKDNSDFRDYLKKNGYKFKNTDNCLGGYAIFRDKKNSIIFDIGTSPEKKYSKEYQSGALSFEIFHENEKLITNCGYFQNFKHQLNILSKSTAAHSTLSVDNQSSCKFKKNISGQFVLKNGLKVIKKKIVHDENLWSAEGMHDGYFKKYGILHYRKIEFYPLESLFKGEDRIINKKNIKDINFDLRFHLTPESSVTQTQDQKSILIQLNKSGWKFTCDRNKFGLETGLFFGKKDTYTENKNIYINKDLSKEEEIIKWELGKI